MKKYSDENSLSNQNQEERNGISMKEGRKRSPSCANNLMKFVFAPIFFVQTLFFSYQSIKCFTSFTLPFKA
jgi:hypothetical protein